MTTSPPTPEPFVIAPTAEEVVQALREVQWSVAFDCLHHETLTPHGRKVLGSAADFVASQSSRIETLAQENERLRAAVRAAAGVDQERSTAADARDASARA